MLAQNQSRRHHRPDDQHPPFSSSTIFTTPSYSISPHLSTLDSPESCTTADFYHDSGDSTPSEQYLLSPRSSPYMTISPSQHPPIRVQSSIPKSCRSHAYLQNPPPMQAGYSASGTHWDYPDNYLLAPQYQQQQPAPAYRSHKRFSSGSSVGSVGPDSPYTQTTAYPYIVDSDTGNGSSPHLEAFDGTYSSGHYPKVSQGASYYSYDDFQQPLNNFNTSTYNADSLMAAQSALKQSLTGQNGSEVAGGTSSSRMPYGDGYDERSIENRSNVPKFSRTLTDAYADELFEPPLPAQPNPALSQARQTGSQGQPSLLSPYSGVFSERLQEATHDHISQRSISPASNLSRGKSPFREGSEFASDGYSTAASNAHSPATRLNSAAQMREQAKAESDAIALAQHQPRPDDLVTPKTISPKEVTLDYNETEEDAKMPLFPQETLQKRSKQPNQANIKQEREEPSSLIANRQFTSTYPAASSVTQSGSNHAFMPPAMPSSNQLPQQYPFLARRQSSIRSTSDIAPEFPAHLNSMESTKSDGSQTENKLFHGLPSSAESSQQSQQSPSSPSLLQRPQHTAADSGTYTCTAPSCCLRFDTAAKLHKHRRDMHRQPSPPRTPNTPITPYAPTSSTQTPTSATFPQSATSASSSSVNRNNQAGPHKCERINPSTGKPCNTIFSRSYDLTRHEDTIHNNRKQKVRCQLCTEDKTFSRNDALTRHMRVVHPDVDFPGKTRRRGG